ncbi:Zinc finger protein 208 [Acipenser ruthenus]|uniref:Zinc finger protein 208 n=1 Tax=Acipenser ruthenus TaxID=7906 RepID=A0A662YKC1_ACIRT|nr:Zinc finger protein 208 [Acipenser ruthenus]
MQDQEGQGGFLCKHCDEVCQSWPDLLEHTESHCLQNDERRFKCGECGRGYRHAGSLVNHRKTHEVGLYRCSVCGKELNNPLALRNHQRLHARGLHCQLCGKTFRLASQLAAHQKCHEGVVPGQHPGNAEGDDDGFPGADSSSLEAGNLLDGREISDGFQQPGACFTDPQRGEGSLGAGGGNVLPGGAFTENLLSFRPAETNASTPLRTCSGKTRGKVSEPCPEPLSSEDRPFKCVQCEKTYRHHGSLINHKKSHQLGAFECRVCFKQFNNLAACNSHVRIHSKSKPSRSFEDSDLSSGVPRSRGGSNGERSNFCHLCQVAFESESEFEDHIVLHNSSSLALGHPDGSREESSVSSSYPYDEGESCRPPPESAPFGETADPGDKTDREPPNGLAYACAFCGECYSDLESLKDHYLTHDSGVAEKEKKEEEEEEAPQTDPIKTENSRNAKSPVIQANARDPATVDVERRFRCQECGKSYRHAGSLVNHKRSHQTGVYQCSICRKQCLNLAALKGHLRIHRSKPPSLSFGSGGLDLLPDWLSNEPVDCRDLGSLENSGSDDVGFQGFGNELDRKEHTMSHFGALAEVEPVEPLGGLCKAENDFEGSGRLENGVPKKEEEEVEELMTDAHLQADRHMCADCGETYADIAGIKSHRCPHRERRRAGQNGFPGEDLGRGERNGLAGSRRRKQAPTHRRLEAEESAGEEEEEEEELRERGELLSEVCQCSVCGNRYSSLSALKSHLRFHTHPATDPPRRGRSSLSSPEPDTSGGLPEEEEESNLQICSTCGESFLNEADFIRHQLTRHESPFPDFLSPDAPRNFTEDEEALCKDGEENQDDSRENKSHICGECGAVVYGNYRELESHRCAHQPGSGAGGFPSDPPQTLKSEDPVGGSDAEARPYRCDQCGRAYRHAGSLLNHKKSHKTGVFRCFVCQKRFYNLLALKNHQRVHFDVKRHKCLECGKAFKLHKQLVSHQRMHLESRQKTKHLSNQLQQLMPASNGPVADVPASKSNGKPLPFQERGDPGLSSTDSWAENNLGILGYVGKEAHPTNASKSTAEDSRQTDPTTSLQLAPVQVKQLSSHACGKVGRAGSSRKQKNPPLTSENGNGLEKKKKRRNKKMEEDSSECYGPAFPSATERLGSDVNDGAAASSLDPDDRPFRCDVCQRTYRHAGSLLNHKNTHKTGSFECVVCQKIFSNPMAMKNHLRIHTQKKPYPCPECGKAFRLSSALQNHQKLHFGDVPHRCQGCGKGFLSGRSLRRHRCGFGTNQKGGSRKERSSSRAAETRGSPGGPGSRRDERPFRCDQCGRTYRHAGSLLNHRNTHTTGIYRCGVCLKQFSNLLALKNHHRIHSEVKRYKCLDCGKAFRVSSHLLSHRRVHTRERPFFCAPCGRGFASKANFAHHLSLHKTKPSHYFFQKRRGGGRRGGMLGEEEEGIPSAGPGASWEDPDRVAKDPAAFECDQCGSFHPTSEDLREHQETHGGDKPHVCEHCGRTYRHAGSLLNHKNSHKTGSYSCSVCQKEFSNLMALKNHRRIHTEPRRYKCQDCGKAFRVSTQLICHQRVHTKEKPFSCSLCGKCFSSKSNLRHHQKVHESRHPAEEGLGNLPSPLPVTGSESGATVNLGGLPGLSRVKAES